MENNETTKESILNSAITLFSQKGYEGVGVQEICLTAEITKPTLYYHFGSKAGLLQNLVETVAQNFVNQVKDSACYNHDFPNTLTKILKTVIQFAKDNNDFFTLHCVLLNSPSNCESKSIYETIKNQLDEIFLNLFKKSCAEFGNMKGKEKLYSKLFQNNVHSVALAVLQNSIKHDEKTIFQIVHSFMYGIAN